MARRQLEQLLAEAAALAERLGESNTDLGPGELDELLKESGHDPNVLRRQLHEGAKAIAARLGKAGKPAPQYLMQVIGATAPLGEFAVMSKKAAVERLRELFRGMASAAAAGIATSSEMMAVSRAHRKKSQISDHDAQLLDKLEAELRSRATTKKKG